jgi:hypothetical protein
MKSWNIKVSRTPQEILKKLDESLGSGKGSVFTSEQKNDSILFKFRKRVLYPDQILHRNRVMVHGEISKGTTENESKVEITFKQHLVLILTISTWFVGGLFALALGLTGRPSAYMYGTILLAIGIVFYLAVQRKFEKDIQTYRALISNILEL